MVNFSILGCGRIGQMHAEIINRLDETNLVRVYDVNREAAESLAKKYNAEWAVTANDAINGPDVDAVLIASATDTHADLIEQTAKAKKPILCEKPIDLSIERVLACKEVLKKFPTKIQIGFNRRFDPGHAAAREALLNGEVGDLLHLIITSRDPEMPPRAYYEVAGGLMRDMTIHDFDLARYFLNEDPSEVFAVGGRVCDPKLMEELNDHDSAMIILKTASGKMCHINNTRAAVYGYDQRIEIHGNKGLLISNNKRNHNLEKTTATQTNMQEPLQFFFIDRYMESYEMEIKAFANAVVNDTEVPVSFADGVKAIQIAEAAYKSVASGKMEQVDYA